MSSGRHNQIMFRRGETILTLPRGFGYGALPWNSLGACTELAVNGRNRILTHFRRSGYGLSSPLNVEE